MCNAFDAIENNYRESRTRGAKSNVIRDEEGHKYTTTGTQAPRNAPGIVSVHYALRGLNKFHLKRILKYFSQVEHLFEKYLDTEQVRLIHSAIELVKAKRFTAPLKGKRKRSNEARIYGGLASGIITYTSSAMMIVISHTLPPQLICEADTPMMMKLSHILRSLG